jgi:hypothetical protein
LDKEDKRETGVVVAGFRIPCLEDWYRSTFFLLFQKNTVIYAKVENMGQGSTYGNRDFFQKFGKSIQVKALFCSKILDSCMYSCGRGKSNFKIISSGNPADSCCEAYA